MIWLVIPTYNEAKNITELISSIFTILPDCNVVVVDDNSPDNTADIVAQMMQAERGIHLIRRSGKLGYASAVVTGLRYALDHEAEYLGHMDADFSHDPKRLPDLLQAVKNEADIALGSRYVQGGGIEGWSLSRQVMSRFGNWVARTFLDLNLKDCTSGFRFYRRDALLKLSLERLRVEGYSFLYLSTALAVWYNLVVVEIPIVFSERRHGKSKLSRKIIYEAGVALVKSLIWRKTGRWLGEPLF